LTANQATLTLLERMVLQHRPTVSVACAIPQLCKQVGVQRQQAVHAPPGHERRLCEGENPREVPVCIAAYATAVLSGRVAAARGGRSDEPPITRPVTKLEEPAGLIRRSPYITRSKGQARRSQPLPTATEGWQSPETMETSDLVIVRWRAVLSDVPRAAGGRPSQPDRSWTSSCTGSARTSASAEPRVVDDPGLLASDGADGSDAQPCPAGCCRGWRRANPELARRRLRTSFSVRIQQS